MSRFAHTVNYDLGSLIDILSSLKAWRFLSPRHLSRWSLNGVNGSTQTATTGRLTLTPRSF